ncbi:hypothetical protein HK101_010312 [Irineochytrium annulatum]|nr:hypothetical protein HK101_010312 [Irineochytrium annulatum]
MGSSYNQSSSWQASALTYALDDLVKEFNRVADVVLVNDPSAATEGASRTITFADYGCSHARNSTLALERILPLARDRECRLDCYLVDVPSNDWSAAEEVLKPLAEKFGCRIMTFEDAATAAMGEQGSKIDGGHRLILTGRSFYERVFGTGTIMLGFSATSFHWLSRRPSQVPTSTESFFHYGGDDLFRKLPTDDRCRREWESLQREDWENILRLRGEEMRKGGGLVITMPGHCRPDVGDGQEGANLVLMFMLQANKMVEEGTLTEEELGKVYLPMYMRTKEEMEEPVKVDASGSGGNVGLKLRGDGVLFRSIEMPGAAELSKSDPTKFANLMVGFYTAVAVNVWREQGLTETKVQRLLTWIRETALARPETFSFAFTQAYMVLEKE